MCVGAVKSAGMKKEKKGNINHHALAIVTPLHESSLPVAHSGYQVLLDILFRLGLIANCFHTVQCLDCSDLN